MSRPRTRGRESPRSTAVATLSQLAVPALVLLACLVFLGAALGGTFRVRQVEVVGAQVPSDAILQAAGLVGENIFTVQSDRVVRELAAVQSIDVRRVDTVFPNKVVIFAHPRRAVVAWKTLGGTYELDAYGRVVQPINGSSLPLIVGRSPTGQLDEATVAATLYAVQVLRDTPNGSLSAIRFGPKRGLVLRGQSGWSAILGHAGVQSMVARVATLVALLRSQAVRGKTLLLADLRYRAAYARFATP